jgi:phosphatidylserine/phosphatidylglycerophosphate/cardiolipin synthase-like enzyme
MHKFKEAIYRGIIAALIIAVAALSYVKYWQPRHETQVYYNRDVAMNQKLAEVIQNADQYVYFAIYTFTKPDIKEALLGAKYRGLDVRGVSDRKQYTEIASQRQVINELRKAGIPVGLHTHDAIMHVKAVVTEKEYASGSFNWTASATTSNDEVLEVGTSEPVRKQYYKIIRHILQEYPAE